MLGALALTWASSDPFGFNHLWKRGWFRVAFVFCVLAAFGSPPKSVVPQSTAPLEVALQSAPPSPPAQFRLSTDELVGPTPVYPSYVSKPWLAYVKCTHDETKALADRPGNPWILAQTVEDRCFAPLGEYLNDISDGMSLDDVIAARERIKAQSIMIDTRRILDHRFHPNVNF